MATQRHPVTALDAAARRFIMGDVPGHNPTFAPSAAELAKECGLQRVALEVAARHRDLPPPEEQPKIEYSAEHRLAMVRRLNAQLGRTIGVAFTLGDDGEGEIA